MADIMYMDDKYIAKKLKIVTGILGSHGIYKNISAINSGDCWIWALLAKKALKSASLCSAQCRYFAHAFVLYNGKYYDSESIHGQKDWFDLEFFKRECVEKHKFEVKENVPIWELEEMGDNMELALQALKQVKRCFNSTYMKSYPNFVSIYNNLCKA